MEIPTSGPKGQGTGPLDVRAEARTYPTGSFSQWRRDGLRYGLRVNTRGVVMQVGVSEFQGLLLGHFAVENHPGECGSKRGARGFNRQPIALFRTDRFVKWKNR